MTTWRQIRRELDNMQDSKLDGEAILYIPAPACGVGEAQVIHLSRFTKIDGDLAEEFDLVEGDPILLVH